MSDQADRSQKTAESAVEGFREKLGPFVVAAETTRMPMVFSNAMTPDHAIIFVNQAFLDLTGYEEHEVLGQKFDFLFQRGTDPEALIEIQSAFEGVRDLETPVCLQRSDGDMIWVSILISAVRDGSGTVVQHFASFADVTKSKREEERLRLLLEELTHRTQSRLATVMAIAGQTFRGIADERAIKAFEGRILALSKTHDLLGSQNWDRVGLRKVLEQTMDTLGLCARVSIEGNNVLIKPKQAFSLTTVFHELATNAMTFGALSTGSEGEVRVTWKLEAVTTHDGSQGAGRAQQVGTAHGVDRVHLHWSETGGPLVSPPTLEGFGRRLIEGGLAEDLNGEVRLDFEPSGVTCEIAMPVSIDFGE